MIRGWFWQILVQKYFPQSAWSHHKMGDFWYPLHRFHLLKSCNLQIKSESEFSTKAAAEIATSLRIRQSWASFVCFICLIVTWTKFRYSTQHEFDSLFLSRYQPCSFFIAIQVVCKLRNLEKPSDFQDSQFSALIHFVQAQVIWRYSPLIRIHCLTNCELVEKRCFTSLVFH